MGFVVWIKSVMRLCKAFIHCNPLLYLDFLMASQNKTIPNNAFYSDMKLSTKCHGNPANGSQHISLKATNFNLLLMLKEKYGEHQRDSWSGDQDCV